MKYLLRDGKVEYSGTKQELIEYIREAYPDDYWVQEYGSILDKDYNKLRYVTECIGLHIVNTLPKKKLK